MLLRLLAASLFLQSVSASAPPSPPAAPPAALRYEVTVLPGSRVVHVQGRLAAAPERVGGWMAGVGGLGEVTRLPGPEGVFHFAYAVAVPERPRSNAPESEVDASRFRGWGANLFLIPMLGEQSVGPIEVCLHAPRGWRTATAAGATSCFQADSADDLMGAPLLAGDFTVRDFEAAGAQVVLALRDGHPTSPAIFQDRLSRLVRGAAAYLDTPPPARIFFGVDRLGQGRPTYAPGSNESGPGYSRTLLIDSDAATTSRRYWGAYAHEYMHSWIPRAFGGPAVTREQLGSVFTEGFSDYLAYRVAFSSRLYTQEQFLHALSQFYLEHQEATERTDEQQIEFLRYRRGMMAAWILDLELLKATRGRAGFREFMRLLFARHLGTDGVTRNELTDALRAVGGERVAALYGHLTDIRRPIRFADHLAGTGITIAAVSDYTAAVEQEAAVVRLSPGGAGERRLSTRWLEG